MLDISIVLNWFLAVAFMATTVVTLLGVTGVLKIKDVYLKRLFAALLLQLVACGFVVIRRGWSPEQEYFRQAKSLFDEAVIARKAGEIDRADKLLGDIIRLSVAGLPFEVRQVFRERGTLMFEKRAWASAVRSLGVYNEIAPDDLAALLDYGRALRAISRNAEALQVYKRAAQLSPNNFEVLNGLQNLGRRMGAFYLAADRVDAADNEFEETRELIDRMLKLSGGKAQDFARYQTALLARARLFWEWRRYQEAIIAFEAVLTEYPDSAPAQEDLAAAILEAGELQNDSAGLSQARDRYRQLFLKKPLSSDTVFIGAGFAEAAALAPDTPQEMLAEAEKAVLTALTQVQSAKEDPYMHYAAAVLFDRMNRRDQAQTYLANAIRYERRRASDMFTSDTHRLVKYERLQERWRSEAARPKS